MVSAYKLKQNHLLAFSFLIFLLVASFQQVFAAVWDWEDGSLQGWRWKKSFGNTGDTLNLTNTTEQAYKGTRSLRWNLQGSSDEGTYWYVFKSNPDVEVNEPALYHVWLPAGAPVNALKTYMRDSSGSWIDGTYYPIGSLQSNAWNEISIQVPANASLPFTEIGLQVHASSNPVNFVMNIDYVASGVPATPQNLTATQQNVSGVLLNWIDNTETDFSHYRVYRDTLSGFSAELSTLLAEPDSSSYLDTGLELYHTYYYLVTAVDAGGTESSASNQISAYISAPGSPPIVQVKSVNTTSVPLYTKFEMTLELQEATYINPYNPKEIDIQATFISPTGKQWTIFGFYDNYNNRNAWKVRFSPNEAGSWHYTVSATDADGTGQSDENQFTAIVSEYNGPVHVSDVNPHYLVHDNGAPFYGVGVYLPWGESATRLNSLSSYDANLFAIWNITYGGLTNSYGIIENELGQYNQAKCGRIDSLIRLAEDRNMIIQYAIWPHDLFSNTVWAHLWHINPYRTVCDVKDIYANELAWDYQEKQYRYLIARFGYSRSWGIWEIVNEANGTDAWEVAHKYTETHQWVGRVHQYFQENDPYNHPTTGSLSGGWYWSEGYQRTDMPCVHMYETGWSAQFAGNPMRSSMWNYHRISQDFWNDFNKPGQFGEAGYTDSYGNYQPGTLDYTTAYHNSLWASWSSGLSMTPLWWDYTILRTQDFNQLKAFASVAPLVDYANENTSILNMEAASCDAFGLGNNRIMFGWIRETNGYSLINKTLIIQTHADTSWHFMWYDTWSGDLVTETYEASMDSILAVEIPEMDILVADMAFIAEVAEGGTVPSQLNLTASGNFLLTSSSDTILIRCVIKDEAGRFCGSATNEIALQKTGPGVLLGVNPVQATDGVVYFSFKSDSVVGTARIVASSPGLDPDTLMITISNRILIDDFEYYGSDAALLTGWKIRAGTTADLYLEKTIVGQGQQSMRYQYVIGGNAPSYSGIIKVFGGDYSGTTGFSFWMKGDGSNRSMSVRIRETTGRYGTYDFLLSSTESKDYNLSYAQFTMNDGGAFNPAKFKEIWFTVSIGSGTTGGGDLYVDELSLKVPGVDPTGIPNELVKPSTFQLFQNYPNPFNNITVFHYTLPKQSHVKLVLYSLTGQRVAELINGDQVAGDYYVNWNAAGKASGVYIYVLETSENRLIRKCVLIK